MPASATVTIDLSDLKGIQPAMDRAAQLASDLGQGVREATYILQHVLQDSRVPGELRSQADSWLAAHEALPDSALAPSILDAADYGPAREPASDPVYL